MLSPPLFDDDHLASLRALVHALASHPGDAIERLHAARRCWADLDEASFRDEDRFEFRHLSIALERPYPRGMSPEETLPWAAHLCSRLVDFSERWRIEALAARPGLRSGVRIRSTPRVLGT